MLKQPKRTKRPFKPISETKSTLEKWERIQSNDKQRQNDTLNERERQRDEGIEMKKKETRNVVK